MGRRMFWGRAMEFSVSSRSSSGAVTNTNCLVIAGSSSGSPSCATRYRHDVRASCQVKRGKSVVHSRSISHLPRPISQLPGR